MSEENGQFRAIIESIGHKLDTNGLKDFGFEWPLKNSLGTVRTTGYLNVDDTKRKI